MNVHQLALACAVNINNKRKYVLLELPRTSAKKWIMVPHNEEPVCFLFYAYNIDDGKVIDFHV